MTEVNRIKITPEKMQKALKRATENAKQWVIWEDKKKHPYIDALGRLLPWPESVWPMTTEDYVKAVPDPHLRTAISGYLMREGWNLCIGRLEELIKECED